MLLKELRGLPVIDPTGARKIGTVLDYQVDPAASRIAALDVTGIEDAETERIPSHRIRRVGRHAVILTGRAGASPSVPAEANEHWLDAASLVGLEVLGDDGNRVGHLLDARFDQDSLSVDTYLLRASLWERLLGRRGRIQPSSVHACSRELMMVTTGRVKDLPSLSDEPTARLEVPLKPEDRVSTPAFEPATDGQTVATR